MKKYFGIFVLALLTSVVSCKKDEVSTDCPDCGKMVETVKDRLGTLQFDAASSRYVIVLHVPGTIDSFVAGYVCDLPKEYQEVGGLVTVNGTFFETSLKYRRDICCIDSSYCLTLSAIQKMYK